jgi:hypothetical protein
MWYIYTNVDSRVPALFNKKSNLPYFSIVLSYNILKIKKYNFNMTSFFSFVDKRERFIDGIISFPHAQVNVTDFSIGSINCVRHFLQM